MLMDARQLNGAAVLETDVCTIGAGPAGLALASHLAGTGVDVLLLESGGPDGEDVASALNDGTVTGDAYAGLATTRSRGLSGTMRLWNTPVDGASGAKYVPLDAWDFAPVRATVPTGWPFDLAHLEPFYARALRLCGLGPAAWDAGAWRRERTPALADGPLVHRVYQFGAARRLAGPLLEQLTAAANARVCTYATACALTLANGRVTGLSVADPAGKRFEVRPRVVVLAGGAIENARLLLVSDPERRLPGHASIGTCFMEHPRDHALTLVPSSATFYDAASFYDRHRSADGTTIGGRLALADGVTSTLDVPNASVTLLPRLRSAGRPGGVPARALAWLRLLGRRRGTEGYGWSTARDPAALFEGFRLLINLEQRPDARNRIVLADAHDAFGVPRAALHWRWRADEHAALMRLRSLIARTLEASGFGRVHVADSRPDPNAHHHAGTTRMHADPAHGVTDAYGRVHGVDNLYVAGASVFPTAGFANPTLTIVALALRLADHLATRR